MERLGEMEIDSFYRDHVCDSNLLEFPCPCRICKDMIIEDRTFYGTCDRQDDIDDGKCSFIIHKECTESKNTPRHIPHHPFHPQHDDDLALSSGHHLSSDQAICNACGDDLKTCFAYKCSTPQCSFALDVKCAFLTLTNISNQGGDLQLPSHPHPLILCNKGKSRICFADNFLYIIYKLPKKEGYFSYSCTCCKLPFNDVDTLLVCLDCKALLHKSCAEIPWKIEIHPFHPSHPLDLLPRVPNPGPCFKCHLCRQKKQDGFAYHCRQCDIFLDVRCASLKPKRNNADDNHDVQQLKHFHPLIVCEDEQNAFPRTCYSCGACGHHFGYRDKMLRYWRRDEVDGDKMYFCHECECLLDQSCADHSGQDIEHVLHPEHKLPFWYRPLLDGHRKCGACLSSIGDSGYQCFECKFYLDIKCSRSNYTIHTSPLHRKPLILHEETDRKERCNVCKKRCNTSFYRSLSRDFVVHVDCMKTFPTEFQSVIHHPHPLTLTLTTPPTSQYLSVVMRLALYRRRMLMGWFICRVCHREEQAGVRYSCNECDYEAHPHCVYSGKRTYQEFKKSFKSDETKEVDSVLLAYGKMDKSNWLYYSHTATTDTDQMPSQKLRFPPWENWDAESKVIETKTGIWILEEFAPLLDALVKKYGDFFSGSKLSPYPKMFFVTTVCEVLHNMSITNVTDVTKDMLLTWFQGFALGKHAGLDMRFAFDRLFRVATAQFGLHVCLFIDPNFARVGDNEVAERRTPISDAEEPKEVPRGGDSVISLEKFKLFDELEKLEKEREELEKTLKEKRSMFEWKKEWSTDTLEKLRKEREEFEKTLKEKRSVYEWKREWLTDTLDLLRENAFPIASTATASASAKVVVKDKGKTVNMTSTCVVL